MMNKRSIAIISLVILMILALAGCQLAQPDTGTAAGEDRLIGVLVTTEYLDLFDTEAYLNDHLTIRSNGEINIDGDRSKYQGRLYAKLVKMTHTNDDAGEKFETKQYAFTDMKGFSYFVTKIPSTEEHSNYTATSSDDSFSDGKTAINAGETNYSLSLEGTLFVSALEGERTYYFNPVYQCDDGSVYATTGSGLSSSADQGDGATMSQTMESKLTTTVNGQTKEYNTSIKITIQVMNPPGKIVVYQMDQNNAILARTEYAPGKLPKTIASDQNTEYILVETHTAGPEGKAQVSRTLFEKGKQSLDTFYCREDGVCVKQWTQLDWAK